MQEELIVGKKGEILPKKPLREKAGIQPGDHVLVEALKNRLIITRVIPIDELMAMPRIAKGTPSSIEKELDEEGFLQEGFEKWPKMDIKNKI